AADGDGALVLLSGRFVNSSTETYFLTTGARANSLEDVRREGIAMAPLLAILAESPGQAILALGTSGTFDPSSPLLSAGPGAIDAPQGVTVLTGPTANLVPAISAMVTGEAVLDADALSGADIAATGYLPRSNFIDFGSGTPAAITLPDPREAEVSYWDAVRQINTVEGYENYLDRYPDGIYATEARELIVDLRDAPRREAEGIERSLNLSRDQRRNIQRALTLLDYNTRGIDGIFGRGTRGAISAFQTAEGFEVTGYLNREQIRRLDRLARARGAELEEEARREAERVAAADRRFWRDTGASGDEEDLRRYLDRYPDGIFAEEARAEIRAIEEIRRPRASAVEQLTWQQVEAAGTPEAYREYLRRYPDGAYSATAREELERLEDAARGGRDRQAAEQGEQRMNLSPATRRTIEQRLDTLNYNPGPVDGRFTNQTRNALLRYQQDRRLPATGYMNDATMVRILADTVISIFE
ncbi:MAG: peptidoglycan-binding domain-containing protein, partial [Pseudomonadota bacterium]